MIHGNQSIFLSLPVSILCICTFSSSQKDFFTINEFTFCLGKSKKRVPFVRANCSASWLSCRLPPVIISWNSKKKLTSPGHRQLFATTPTSSLRALHFPLLYTSPSFTIQGEDHLDTVLPDCYPHTLPSHRTPVLNSNVYSHACLY